MRKQTKIVAVTSAAALLALGASMTSFAAGWTQEDGEWVYLDKYGDRTYNEWKKSGSDYYYLNDDGVMATDYVVVEEDGNKYYVDATGKKVTNQWVALDNEEEVIVGENEVDTLWMYFDNKGKAVKAAENKEANVKELSYSGGKAKFAFDADGYMYSGWQELDGKLYYLGDENEGWALTGWQYLEPDEDIFVPYDDSQWFYFDKGVAVQGKTKYINGKYYTFNEDGTLDDDWFTAATPASGAKAYASIDGTTGLGWVKAEGIDNEDKTYWYYLENVRNEGKVARGIPFNYGGQKYAAKSIKGKTYLFNANGEMQTGIVNLTDGGVAAVEGGKALEAGYYYFNKAADGVEGQMVTGRFTITEDAEEFYYHFAKNGKAYANQIKDGVLYGENGRRIQAEDGNTYELVTVSGVEVVGKDKTVSGLIAVNANGRVKTSGSIKIDDVYYDVDAATYNVTKRAAN